MEPQRLRIVPIGGLANRMRAIVSGLALRGQLGIRDCEIIWPVNADLYCEFEGILEPIPGVTIRNVSAYKDLFIYDVPRKKNLFVPKLLSAFNSEVILSDNDFLGGGTLDNPARIEKVMTATDVTIRSGLSFYEFDEDFYREIIRPTPDLYEMACDRIPAERRCIGLHVRRSDNTQSIKFSPLSLFTERIESEFKNNADVCFYLATDDNGIKTQLISRYGSDKIICSPKRAVRNTKEGILEAMTELLTLSMCERIYGSYWSSYSEAAALLGKTELIQLSIKK